VSALDALVAAYESPKAPASGVVGYVGDDVPRELIAAAGLHPLRLRGSVPVTKRADAILGTGVDAPARAVLAGLLEGRPQLDYLLLSHDSDATVRLFTALRVLAGTEPLPELWFLDVLHLPTETTAAYNRERLNELRDVLGRWSCRPVSEEGLARAAVEAAETRRLVAAVDKLRIASTPRLRGSDVFAIAGATGVLAAADANRLLEELLADPPGPRPETSRRVFVVGSTPMGTDLFTNLEAQELHVAGERFGRQDPRAIATAAKSVDADVVLAWIRAGDGARAWSLPALRAALELPLVVLDRRADETLSDMDLALLG
jgi:benzoyl-CoA reductase/2-hydroxyglutaryl-CoA dehydratase subunit BcrC/BadD/HgdB